MQRMVRSSTASWRTAARPGCSGSKGVRSGGPARPQGGSQHPVTGSGECGADGTLGWGDGERAAGQTSVSWKQKASADEGIQR